MLSPGPAVALDGPAADNLKDPLAYILGLHSFNGLFSGQPG